MFPRPVAVLRQPCARCGTATRVDRLVAGRYGEDCAARLGLIVSMPRGRATAQDGSDLLDVLAEEPEDECDGWDRPADRPDMAPKSPVAGLTPPSGTPGQPRRSRRR